jgi:hypothetical protein
MTDQDHTRDYVAITDAERKAAHDSGVIIAREHMAGNREFVSQLPTRPRKGAYYCRHCETPEAMPGHQC